MADLSQDELRFLKSLNQKAKGIGGEVTISWNIGHKIEKWAIRAEESGDTVYNANPTSGQGMTGDLKD